MGVHEKIIRCLQPVVVGASCSFARLAQMENARLTGVNEQFRSKHNAANGHEEQPLGNPAAGHDKQWLKFKALEMRTQPFGIVVLFHIHKF